MTGYNDDECKDEEEEKEEEKVIIALVKQTGKILAKECDEFVGIIMKYCCSESSFRYLGCAASLFSHVGIHHLVTVITP